VTVHRIGEDLEAHGWYDELVRATLAELEAYVARWAAFAEYTAARDAGEADAA
jgi:hypothetical protein